jgi:diguanylate cyclase (GGDEF)-like protein
VLYVERIDGQPISLHLGEHEFECEDETGYVMVPKEFLRGFRLSDIPDDISIKPVETIEGRSIELANDVALSSFHDGSATAGVEEMFRRKYWDGETGLSPYVAALRQAIAGHDGFTERHFEDDGDYVFLQYEVRIAKDFDIQEAIHFVERSIEQVQSRAEQLVSRRKDGLLGIFDRGSFEVDLTYALACKQPVALVMVDIDHFKRVNDTFGHLVGDRVLRAVAKILTGKCDGRSSASYRYGGEELGIILTGDAAAKAMQMAESVRADVEQFRFDEQPDLIFTASLGVADAPDTAQRKAVELVKRADVALYRAKEGGRNRVQKAE